MATYEGAELWGPSPIADAVARCEAHHLFESKHQQTFVGVRHAMRPVLEQSCLDPELHTINKPSSHRAEMDLPGHHSMAQPTHMHAGQRSGMRARHRCVAHGVPQCVSMSTTLCEPHSRCFPLTWAANVAKGRRASQLSHRMMTSVCYGGDAAAETHSSRWSHNTMLQIMRHRAM